MILLTSSSDIYCSHSLSKSFYILLGTRSGSCGLSPDSSAYEDAYTLGQESITRRVYGREYFGDSAYITGSQSTENDNLNIYPAITEVKYGYI